MGEKSLSLMIKTLSHLSQMLLGMFSLLNITLPEGRGELLHIIAFRIGEMIFRTEHPRAVFQASLKDKKENKPASPAFKNSRVQMGK